MFPGFHGMELPRGTGGNFTNPGNGCRYGGWLAGAVLHVLPEMKSTHLPLMLLPVMKSAG